MLDTLSISRRIHYTDTTELGNEARKKALDIVSTFEKDCSELGLVGTAASLRRLVGLLSSSNITDEKLHKLTEDINLRLIDEITTHLFLTVDAQEAAYFLIPSSGWEEVISRFPSAREDIEEACKCYALERYAATVFHSVQVVEHGLIELGTFIGVNDPLSGWTAVSNRLNAILKTNYQDRSEFEKANGQMLEQLHGTTEALKNAWRNKISHSQGRLAVLVPHFTPQVAEEIMFATRAFMRRLAESLPRRGTTEST